MHQLSGMRIVLMAIDVRGTSDVRRQMPFEHRQLRDLRRFRRQAIPKNASLGRNRAIGHA